MKKHITNWLVALAIALGCTVPGLAADFEYEESPQSPVIQQTSTAHIRWAEQQPQTQLPNGETLPAPGLSEPTTDADGNQLATTAPPSLANCGSCDSCCDGPLLSLVAGAEATFFWPQFSRDFLRTQYNNGLGSQVIESSSAVASTDGSLLVGPRLTLGVQGERWGLIGRYWNASTWATGFAPLGPTPITNGITAYDAFNAYTADLELQRRFCWCNWNMYGFGGVRYGSVNNDRSLTVTNTFGNEIVSASSYAGQQFNGTGITFGLLGMRPLFDCSPFKLYFANRYSFLWGTGKVGSATSASVVDGAGAAVGLNNGTAGGDGCLFIAEVQLGVQWDAQLKCLPGRAFVRTGFEYQYWNTTTGIDAGSNSFAQGVNSSAASLSLTGDFLFSLVGFTVGAGVMY